MTKDIPPNSRGAAEVIQAEELKPCAFCGSAIERIESWARAFSPARLFHEYHHPQGGDCFIRKGCLWSGEAGSDDEAAFIARWNYREALTKTQAQAPFGRERRPLPTPRGEGE